MRRKGEFGLMEQRIFFEEKNNHQETRDVLSTTRAPCVDNPAYMAQNNYMLLHCTTRSTKNPLRIRAVWFYFLLAVGFGTFTLSHADVSSLFTRVLQARQLFSAGRQGERMAQLLEETRRLYLHRVTLGVEEQGFNDLTEQAIQASGEIRKNLNTLRVMARRDPITLAEAKAELAFINKELTDLSALTESLGAQADSARQIFLQNQVILNHAKGLAETRLLAARVREAGPNGIQKMRKELTDARASLQAQAQSSADSARRAEILQQAKAIDQKLNRLLDVEIASSGSIQRAFHRMGVPGALAQAEDLLKQAGSKASNAQNRLSSASRRNRTKRARAYQTALQELKEASSRLGVMKEEADAWTAALSAL